MSREWNLILRANATPATSDFKNSDKGINTHGKHLTCRQFGLSVLDFT